MVGLLLGGAPLAAQTSLYWDIDGPTAGAGGATPTGGWRTNNVSYQNWNTAADGTGAATVWTAGSIAVFSAGSDATGSYTVTVNTVSADSIVIEQGNVTFSSSTITLTGTTPSVNVASGLTATIGSGLAGTAGFVKSGDGTVIFQTTAKNYTGDTLVNAGTLRLGTANMIGNAVDVTVASGATFDLNGFADTIGSLAGAGTLSLGSATLVLDGDGESTEFSGGISGTGGLSKTGTDTLVLSGASTYTGATSVTAGVLNIRHSAALGTADAGTTVTSGEELQLQGNIAVGAEALSLTGTGVSTTGALRNISGDNSLAGAITLAGNTRITADADSLTLTGGVIAAGNTLTIAGAGDVSLSGTSTGSGSLTKLDAGTLTLGGTNNSTGATTIGTAGGTATGTVSLSSDHGLASGTLTNYASTLDLNGYDDTIGALTLGGGAAGTTATVTTGAGTLTLGGNLTYSATNNADGATISGNLDLGGANRTFNIGNSTAVADDLLLSAAISGSAGLIKSGTGTLVLSGANTYTGTTTVSAGVLNIRDSSALGTADAGTTVATNSALQLQGGIAVGAEALSLTGTGVSTTGALRNISGNNSFAGLVTLAGATRIASDSGTLALGGGVSAANQTLTVAGAGNITIAGASNLGSGGLVKLDSSLLTLAGTNSSTGATTIGAAGGSTTGTLRLGADHGLASGTLTLYSGTLDLNGYDDTIGALTLGGGATGTTATVTTGTGGVLTLGGNLTYSATNNADGAVISGALDLGGADRTFNIGDSTAVADDVIISAVISGSAGLNKATSAGTLVLSGANTYTGLTQVTAGVLNIRHSSALGTTDAGTVVTSGDQLQLQGGIAVGAETLSLAGSGISTTGALRNISGDNSFAGAVTLTNTTQINSDAGNLTLSGGVTGANRALTLDGAGNLSISAITTGTGSLTKNGGGTVTLTGASTYTGATTVNTGTLRLGASNALSDSTALTLASGATFDLNDHTDAIATLAGAGTVDIGSGSLTTAGNGSTTFSGAMAGTGSFTKQGTGVLTLDTDLTFDGTFNLAGGTLRLSDITLTLGTLNITGNSFIDFAGVSSLNVTNFNISGGVTLTIQNWANASDYFFTQFWTGATMEVRGAAPMNQITFTGFAAADTKWQAYDSQITPVPEPSTYGAFLLAATGGLLAWRRRVSRRAA